MQCGIADARAPRQAKLLQMRASVAKPHETPIRDALAPVEKHLPQVAKACEARVAQSTLEELRGLQRALKIVGISVVLV